MKSEIEQWMNELPQGIRSDQEAAACAAWFERCGEALSKELLEDWLVRAAALAGQYKKGAPAGGRFDDLF